MNVDDNVNNIDGCDYNSSAPLKEIIKLLLKKNGTGTLSMYSL